MYMLVIYSVLCLAAVVLSDPAVVPSPGYGYAVDVDTAVPAESFVCMKEAGYSAAFIRGYDYSGEGSLDANAAANIKNAQKAGLHTEVFMPPHRGKGKFASQQIEELYEGLKSNGITLKRVWIQVHEENKWTSNFRANFAFLKELANAAKEKYGLSIGYFTSKYEWSIFMKKSAPVDTTLWYSNINDMGESGETPANFDDFEAFSVFTQPVIKQFGRKETRCLFNESSQILTSKKGNSILCLHPIVENLIFTINVSINVYSRTNT
ncbi:hypothetical protein OESDEN_08754 [Oesophagostomum dentatum]|uniref:Glycosyl hydrolase family 25 n=1 Tax=Oesophagostomum dentatum TaxID=61180 RepID=A0A0B1T2A4_OESDE|nr:hypothetical protein OESDEN_08754 [Oesophagostomum dentatum]